MKQLSDMNNYFRLKTVAICI